MSIIEEFNKHYAGKEIKEFLFHDGRLAIRFTDNTSLYIYIPDLPNRDILFSNTSNK